MTSGASTWLATTAAAAASAAATAATCVCDALGGLSAVVETAPLLATLGAGPEGASTVAPHDAAPVFIFTASPLPLAQDLVRWGSRHNTAVATGAQ